MQSQNTQMQNLSPRKKIVLAILAFLAVAEGGLLIYRNYYFTHDVNVINENRLKEQLALIDSLSSASTNPSLSEEQQLESLNKLDKTSSTKTTPAEEERMREERLKILESLQN